MWAGGLWGHQDYIACLASYTFSGQFLSNIQVESTLQLNCSLK